MPVCLLWTLCSLSLIAVTWVQHMSRELKVPDTSQLRVEGDAPLQRKISLFALYKRARMWWSVFTNLGEMWCLQGLFASMKFDRTRLPTQKQRKQRVNSWPQALSLLQPPQKSFFQKDINGFSTRDRPGGEEDVGNGYTSIGHGMSFADGPLCMSLVLTQGGCEEGLSQMEPGLWCFSSLSVSVGRLKPFSRHQPALGLGKANESHLHSSLANKSPVKPAFF